MKSKIMIGAGIAAVVLAGAFAAAAAADGGKVLPTSSLTKLDARATLSTGSQVVPQSEMQSVTEQLAMGTLTLSPVPSGTAVTITPQQALSAYEENAPMGPSGIPTSITLASVTKTTGPLRLANQLAWVVRYSNVAVPLYGPAGTPTSISGTWVGIVDANTGAYLDTQSFN